MLPYVGIAHAAIILSLFAISQRASSLDFATRIIAVVVAGWANLVLTAVALSTISALNRPYAYAGVAILLSLPLMLLMARLGRRPVERAPPLLSLLDGRGISRGILLGFLVITGLLVSLGNVVIALGYLPNNSDTVAYRLPRIYWYIAQGNLGHFAFGIDPRAIYYPFNGTLLQLPIVLYGWSVRLFSLVPLAAWSLVGLTTYGLARECGFSARAGGAAAWLVCLTPGVLVQAVSTNDEIIAASILLAGIHFAVRFYRRRMLADLCFALIAASLSVGTKLHIFFFWPILPAAVLFLLLKVQGGAELPWLQNFNRRSIVLLVPVGLVCVVLAAAFAWSNWRASGQIMDSNFSGQVLNQPFSLRAGAQNLVLHLAQVVMSPLIDLNMNPDFAERIKLAAAYREALAWLFTWVNQGPEFMSASYRFAGAVQSGAWFLNENSVDLGFGYLLILGAWATCATRTGVFRVGLTAAAAFIVWFVTYSLSMRYVEGFSTYLAYGFVVCAPAVVFFLAQTGRGAWRLRAILLVAVVATHALIDFNILRFNASRNVPNALAAKAWPLNPPAIDASVMQVIREHGGAHFLATHWQIPFWLFMAAYKTGRFSVGHPSLVDPSRLNIFPFQKFTAYGYIPVRVPHKATPGLSLLGSFTSDYGPEWALASGGGIEGDERFRHRYITLQIFDQPAGTGGESGAIAISPTVYGASAEDRLEFRYGLKTGGQDGALSEWSISSAHRESLGVNADGAALIVEVRSPGSPQNVIRVNYPLHTSQSAAIDER